MRERKLGEKALAWGMLLIGGLGLMTGLATPLYGRPLPLGLLGISALLALGAAISLRTLFRR